MSTIEILHRHLESEYNYAKVGVQVAASLEEKIMIIRQTIQRCLGMATIVQSFGASFEEVESLYNEFKNKVKELGNIYKEK